MMIQVGLENLGALGSRRLESWGRCGLLSNQASVTRDLSPAWSVVQKLLGDRLTCLFGPQHGFESTVQDNMIETSDGRHLPTGLPVFSLYSNTRVPTESMLAHVDTIIIDLQVVGCRVYTYKASIAACLQAAKKFQKKIVILDRPNPLGGILVEGRVLDRNVMSFVGPYPMPMRHGLTPAEAGRLFNQEIGADLEWVEMSHWNPAHYWHQINRHWVLTSPNLPTIDPVYVFPGMVLFEGTNISEGRGTGLPFQFIGAPYIEDAHRFTKAVKDFFGPEDGGVILRPSVFQPTSQKWQNETCQGLQIHVLDPHKIRSFDLALSILAATRTLVGDAFEWKLPPYEYDYENLPIDLIVGSKATTQHFNEFSLNDPFWHEGLDAFIEHARPLLLYPRTMKSLAR
jgi:uncharacterized protein YbbC (DUF1343 family)